MPRTNTVQTRKVKLGL